MTPYDILNVDLKAGDSEIRGAYLELVKKHPPDRNPEKFKAINDAYEKVKNEHARLNYLAFNKNLPFQRPFEALLLEYGKNEYREPPNFESFKEIMREWSK